MITELSIKGSSQVQRKDHYRTTWIKDFSFCFGYSLIASRLGYLNVWSFRVLIISIFLLIYLTSIPSPHPIFPSWCSFFLNLMSEFGKSQIFSTWMESQSSHNPVLPIPTLVGDQGKRFRGKSQIQPTGSQGPLVGVQGRVRLKDPGLPLKL